jgi:hypothetical protein
MLLVLLVLTVAIARQYPDEKKERRAEALAEFLAWADPATEECGSPEKIKVVRRWPGFLRVRYQRPCAPPASFDALLEIREGAGVWQVRGGYVASRRVIDRALALAGGPDLEEASGADDFPWPSADDERVAGPPSTVSPPPDNLESDASSAAAILPARALHREDPVVPVEAGRARLFSPVRVEILVDVSAAGGPRRARILRGPQPDLGMRRAAVEASRRWRFAPAVMAGEKVRSFAAFNVVFEGLPPESLGWIHRALFRFDAVISADDRVIDEALERLRRGDPFNAVAAGSAAIVEGWGGAKWVPAAGLPPAVRRALHEAAIGQVVGPVDGNGRAFLLRKSGEVYYAIRSLGGAEPSYEVLHEVNGPSGGELDYEIRRDIAAHLLESRRRAYVNEAARLMGIRLARTEIDRLLVHTDVLAPAEVETLGRVVESAVQEHERFWGERVPLRPLTQEILVYAFARQEDHDRLHRLWAGSGSPHTSTQGEYIPSSRILSLPCEAMGGHLPVPYLIHEAIHMLNYERVYAEGTVTSRWFEEGLASYFGFSRVDARLRIAAGDIDRSSLLNLEGVRIQFDPRTELREHRRRLEQRGPLPLRLLVGADQADALWTGGPSSRAYGSSWSLVHFLMHGEKGKHRPAFMEYAELEANGRGGLEAFAGLFGPDLDAFEASWHEYEAGL